MDGSSQCQADAATITPGLVIDRGRERERGRGREGGNEGGDGEGEAARGASITPLNLPVTLGAWQGKRRRLRGESRERSVGETENCNVVGKLVLK